MKTPVTKATLKHHFTYCWWMYVLVAALGFLGINLLYTVTAYRIPAEKKVRLIVYGLTDSDTLNNYMESVRQNEMQDMELMEHEYIVPDALNGLSALSTKIYAREGDLYLLPSDIFQSYAEEGVLLPLENDAELMAVLDKKADLTRGWWTLLRSNEQHLFGIPLDQLPGFTAYAWADRGFICLPSTDTNEENAMKFLRILCRDMLTLPETETASPSPETP